MRDNRAGEWRLVDDERRDILAFFRSLTPADRVTPSLCSGWCIRDVAAHLLIDEPVQAGMVQRVLPMLVRGGFSVERANAWWVEQNRQRTSESITKCFLERGLRRRGTARRIARHPPFCRPADRKPLPALPRRPGRATRRPLPRVGLERAQRSTRPKSSRRLGSFRAPISPAPAGPRVRRSTGCCSSRPSPPKTRRWSSCPSPRGSSCRSASIGSIGAPVSRRRRSSPASSAPRCPVRRRPAGTPKPATSAMRWLAPPLSGAGSFLGATLPRHRRPGR